MRSLARVSCFVLLYIEFHKRKIIGSPGLWDVLDTRVLNTCYLLAFAEPNARVLSTILSHRTLAALASSHPFLNTHACKAGARLLLAYRETMSSGACTVLMHARCDASKNSA